jgi:hypothetical protein
MNKLLIYVQNSDVTFSVQELLINSLRPEKGRDILRSTSLRPEKGRDILRSTSLRPEKGRDILRSTASH